MTKEQKNEIRQLDPRYRPISAWGYFGLQLLYSIPLVGFILLIIHAVSAKNINKKNFAKSYFCFLVIILIFVLILFLTGGLATIIATIGGSTEA